MLNDTRFRVYDALFRHGPLTGGELFRVGVKNGYWLGSKIKGSICARLTELRQQGVTEEQGVQRCSYTGKKAIVWDVTDRLPIKLDKNRKPSNKKIIEDLKTEIRRLKKVLFSVENRELYCSRCNSAKWIEVRK